MENGGLKDCKLLVSINSMVFFDTHTHFDFEDFKTDRLLLAQQAFGEGVHHLLISGYQAQYFQRIIEVQAAIHMQPKSPKVHTAFGLHPAYISLHKKSDFEKLEACLQHHSCVALGEIGIDTYDKPLKSPSVIQKQETCFSTQLGIASSHGLPVILHIRKAHAKVISCLKKNRFSLGGVAHSFSGGVQEAKALIDLGFKIGVTAQVCNPNAKKLRNVLKTIGHQHLVAETDCPDMYPITAPIQNDNRRNHPSNICYVIDELGKLLDICKIELAEGLYENSLSVFGVMD